MTLSHSPNIVRDGLVFYLDAANPKSYPGSGTTWFDLSGNGNNGELVNGVVYDSDSQGTMVFDGSNDRVTTSNNVLLNSLTYIVLASKANINDTSLRGLIGNHTIGTNISINSDDNDVITSMGFVEGRTIYRMRTLCFEENDRFYHIVFTFNKTNNQIQFFINGVLKSSSIVLETVEMTPSPLVVGRWSNNYNDYYHVGNIAFAQAYNRVLTENEVKQSFNALRGRYGI